MKNISSNCFNDKELKSFIIAQSTIGDCQFSNHRNTNIISIVELLDFFKELFDNFKKDEKSSDNLVNILQGKWGFFSSNDIAHKIINYTINKTKTAIKNSEESVSFNDDILENINFWHTLKEQLKWERRYLTNINYLTEDLGWDGFFESKSIINSEDIFFRARLHSSAEMSVFTKTNMFCPPKEISTSGRANPLGIPYLYLSDNQETILYEIRASYLDEVSIARFITSNKIKKTITISDFTEIATLYHPTEVNKKIKSTLLKQIISRDLSKPMRRYDSELDYIPTQFICEFIRIFTNVEGIKFRSSLHNIGNNYVIFDQNLMECIDVEKVQIRHFEIST